MTFPFLCIDNSINRLHMTDAISVVLVFLTFPWSTSASSKLESAPVPVALIAALSPTPIIPACNLSALSAGLEKRPMPSLSANASANGSYGTVGGPFVSSSQSPNKTVVSVPNDL